MEAEVIGGLRTGLAVGRCMMGDFEVVGIEELMNWTSSPSEMFDAKFSMLNLWVKYEQAQTVPNAR